MDERKLGFIAGSVLTAAVVGCGATNQPPTITVSEANGEPIRTWNDSSLAHQNNWNEAIVLPINEGDVLSGNADFLVEARDLDGPKKLGFNFYAVDPAANISITRGENSSTRVEWYVQLNSTNLPRGGYPIAEGIAYDGVHKRSIGIIALVGNGSTYNPDTNTNGPDTNTNGPDPNQYLNDIADAACESNGLRSEGTDISLYMVNRNASGILKFEKNVELDPSSPEGSQTHHKWSGNPLAVLYVAGTGFGDISSMTTSHGEDAMVRSYCDSVLVENPNSFLTSDKYTVSVQGKTLFGQEAIRRTQE